MRNMWEVEKNLRALRRQDHRRGIGGVIGWPGAAVAGCGTGAKRKGKRIWESWEFWELWEFWEFWE